MGSFCYPLSAAARHTRLQSGIIPIPIPDLVKSGMDPHPHPRFESGG